MLNKIYSFSLYIGVQLRKFQEQQDKNSNMQEQNQDYSFGNKTKVKTYFATPRPMPRLYRKLNF